MYNDTVLDHFSNPRNIGEIAGADGVGTMANPIMLLSIIWQSAAVREAVAGDS